MDRIDTLHTITLPTQPRDSHYLHRTVYACTAGTRALWALPAPKTLVVRSDVLAPELLPAGSQLVTRRTCLPQTGARVLWSLIASPAKTVSPRDPETRRSIGRGKRVSLPKEEIPDWVIRKLSPALSDITVADLARLRRLDGLQPFTKHVISHPRWTAHGTLPWSVLRQDSKAWQARKAYWAALGVDDTTPRAHAAGMMATGRHGATSGGVSRFDPHLAEILYSWFCPPGGAVLDPFAGGPVRGLVASHLGHPYTGIDLLHPQVQANQQARERWHQAGWLNAPVDWHVADSLEMLPTLEAEGADYVLGCPPYHNREKYSDHPKDLSAMRWAEFLAAHQDAIAQAVRVLRPDRFATWVISDVRDHKGHLRGLPHLTVSAFLAAGAHLVNDQVLVAPLGLAAKRMRPPWTAARTTTRIHQHVLTFVKGDRKKAAAACRRPGGS